MARVLPGRVTAAHDDDVVVFLIGMRVNRWSAVRAWWPVFKAMPAMLKELSQNPSAGFLGARGALGPNGPLLVQYWRSLDQLLAYAHDHQALHRPAWRDFNRRARESRGAVGIWHETFAVPRGAHESVYVDMPPSGLAAATAAVPVRARTNDARSRLRLAGEARRGAA
ncbi:MAG TPA: DUF4188 domain-containing protein [Actinomycetales bacterium]|nr:DUF4188 domain-containing protein [Actinomycetales bacterium]